jgi:hypothetical protein
LRGIGGEFIDFLFFFVFYFFMIQVIKSRKLICAEHVARIVGKRNLKKRLPGITGRS